MSHVFTPTLWGTHLGRLSVFSVYCLYMYFVYCVYLCCVYWDHDRCTWIECTGLRKLYVHRAFLLDLEIMAFDMGNHSWPFSNICHIFIFQILVFCFVSLCLLE